MTNNVLIEKGNYDGEYVAIRSLDDNTVIAHGKDPAEVLKESAKKGYPGPVLFFVPEKDATYIL